MLYLYLGYLLVQLYSIVDVISGAQMSFDAVFFSVVVFLIWSFIPLLGHVIAKLFKAKGRSSNLFLFCYGFFVGLIVKLLFYFNVLTAENQDFGLIASVILFTAAAFFSVNFTPLQHRSKQTHK